MTDRNFVTALSRGLELLRCFQQPGIELTVSELARRVGLNQPTTWRLCHTLIECGFLVRVSDSVGLRIGAPALTLGYAALEGLSFATIAFPYMQEVTARTKGSLTLSVRQGLEMISVRRCDGEFVLPNQPIGWHSPIISVPSGLAVLVGLPEPDRDAAIARIKAEAPGSWPHRADRIEKALHQYTQEGIVIREGMLDGQYAAIAVPLIGRSGGEIRAWGLSCGGLSARWDTERLRRVGHELLRIQQLLQPLLAVPELSPNADRRHG